MYFVTCVKMIQCFPWNVILLRVEIQTLLHHVRGGRHRTSSLIWLWLKVSANKQTYGSIKLMCVSSGTGERHRDREQKGSVKREYFSICLKFVFVRSGGLSYWIHIVFTLEFKQSWNQVWHSFCSICLTGVCLFVFVFPFVCVYVCERERKRERESERELVFYLMASHISKPIFTQFLAWWGSDSGRPDTQ